MDVAGITAECKWEIDGARMHARELGAIVAQSISEKYDVLFNDMQHALHTLMLMKKQKDDLDQSPRSGSGSLDVPKLPVPDRGKQPFSPQNSQGFGVFGDRQSAPQTSSSGGTIPTASMCTVSVGAGSNAIHTW